MPDEDNGNVPVQAGPETIKPVLIVPVILITMFAGGALALVNAVTEEPIAASKKAEKQTALEAVMPAFANDPTVDLHTREAGGNPLVFYAGRDDGGKLTGWGVESATETGYSGHFSVVFGIDPQGKINGVQVLESKETPGLGTKAQTPEYLSQYDGKSRGDFKLAVAKDGGDVEAITGATVTSRAVAVCVEQGLDEFDRSFKGKDPGPAAPPAGEGGD